MKYRRKKNSKKIVNTNEKNKLLNGYFMRQAGDIANEESST